MSDYDEPMERDDDPVRVETERHGEWSVPQWGEGPIARSVAMGRADIARRIWPGLVWRIVAATDSRAAGE